MSAERERLRPWLRHHEDVYEPEKSCLLMPSVRPDNPNCTCGLKEAFVAARPVEQKEAGDG